MAAAVTGATVAMTGATAPVAADTTGATVAVTGATVLVAAETTGATVAVTRGHRAGGGGDDRGSPWL